MAGYRTLRTLEMKKVCLVTWYKSVNYGTCLQAYALDRIIKKMGYNCYVYDYCLNRPDFSSTLLSNILKITRSIKSKLFFLMKCNYIDMIKLKRLEGFVENNFQLTKIKNAMQRDKFVSSIDYFVTGSDQIWNPYYINTNYLLDFVSGNKIKIAYASSIGVDKIPFYLRWIYRRLLDRFNHIGVREEQGAKIVEELINRKVSVVLDPTFLLSAEEWKSFSDEALIIDKHLYRKYILCYFVGDNNEYWQAVQEIEKLTDLEIVVIPMTESSQLVNLHKYTSAGPHEFVWFIKHAELVCTDSFHATALSIVLKKDFIEFKRFSDDDKTSQNSRIYEILHKYSLTDRFYRRGQINMLGNIDYSCVSDILDRDKLKSIEYLRNAFLCEGSCDCM